MKHKTSELEGALLDAAVAKAEGWEWRIIESEKPFVWLIDGPDINPRFEFRPSTDWSDGGPIIERERIKIEHAIDYWDAAIMSKTSTFYHQTGSTPLIAAMRAYVASKLGEEVEL